MRTAAILPVKRFSLAKQRLGASVAEDLRAELARAMVGDVLSALRSCAAIDAIVVVTNEPSVTAAARYLGAVTLDDRSESGQSAAAQIGLSWALEQGFDAALCVPGDCPALDPSELDLLLAGPHRTAPRDAPMDGGRAGSTDDDAEARHVVARVAQVAIVPDRHGTGTNGLLLAPPDAIAPSFGPDSRARHEQLASAAGVACSVERLPSLLLDVDTGEDLTALRASLADESARATRTRTVLDRFQRRDPTASAAA
jgi:2-phospho-L-lactate/phosphoenolpyruvate guanylyltransferase